MSNAYLIYSYIVKVAADDDGETFAERHPRITGAANLVINPAGTLIGASGVWGGVSNAYQKTTKGVAGLRDTIYGSFNPWEDDESRKDSVAYKLGQGLSDFFVPKVYDPDDLGPYEEYTRFLKDTEEGDMYLREAEKLRRRARMLKRLKQREEEGKRHASASRYF